MELPTTVEDLRCVMRMAERVPAGIPRFEFLGVVGDVADAVSAFSRGETFTVDGVSCSSPQQYWQEVVLVRAASSAATFAWLKKWFRNWTPRRRGLTSMS